MAYESPSTSGMKHAFSLASSRFDISEKWTSLRIEMGVQTNNGTACCSSRVVARPQLRKDRCGLGMAGTDTWYFNRTNTFMEGIEWCLGAVENCIHSTFQLQTIPTSI